MREDLARWMALLSAAVVVLLAIFFAQRQNPPATVRGGAEAPTMAPPQLRELRAEAGRAVYDARNCATCHSIAGAGNPRNPLDGIGTRLDRPQLQQWIVGAPEVAARLSPGVVRTKQTYAALPEAEMQALIDYLQTLGY